MHTRDRAAELDFSEVLAEEVESELKEAAAISMGTDISESDILNILALCEQVRTAPAVGQWAHLRAVGFRAQASTTRVEMSRGSHSMV